MIPAEPVWENEVYGAGKFARCPYDYVASFVFRNAPDKPRRETRILELGCGAGNNLWFLNSEGFACSGFDASPSAIAYARGRLGAAADLKVGEFPEIPFSGPFDLIFDRAALCYVPFDVLSKTMLPKIRSLLAPGGRFLFTPYSGHSANVGSSCVYYTRDMIDALFTDWRIVSLAHVRGEDGDGKLISAEWRVVVE